MAPQGSMDGQERPTVGAGLQNLGNTCFLNAVLQCLTYTPPLTIYLLSREHSQSCLLPSSCVMCQMQKHVDNVLRPGATSIMPLDILMVLDHIGQERFKVGHQEDAHEFLRCTLEAMQMACLPATGNLDISFQPNIIHEIFGSFLRSRVMCLSCRRASERFEPFLDVLLDIKAAASVTEALENFVKPEQLDAGSSFRCRLCGQMAAATKTSTIHWAPEVLTLCLKRFGDSTGVKITKVVQYPPYLDLGPYMTQASGEPHLYKLYAVLVHSGHSCHSGHYYCYIKARDSLWYKMDDSSVTHSDINTALNQEAYLLFYLRCSDHQSLQTASSPLGPPSDQSRLERTSTSQRSQHGTLLAPASTGQQYQQGTALAPATTGQQIQPGSDFAPASIGQNFQDGSSLTSASTGQLSQYSQLHSLDRSAFSLGPPCAHSTFARASTGQQPQHGTPLAPASTGQQSLPGHDFVPVRTGQGLGLSYDLQPLQTSSFSLGPSCAHGTSAPAIIAQQPQHGTPFPPASTGQQSLPGSDFGPGSTGQGLGLSYYLQPLQTSSFSLGPSCAHSTSAPASTGQQSQQDIPFPPATIAQQSLPGSDIGPGCTGQGLGLSYYLQPLQTSSFSLGPSCAHCTSAAASTGQQIQQGTPLAPASTGQQYQQGTPFPPATIAQQSLPGSDIGPGSTAQGPGLSYYLKPVQSSSFSAGPSCAHCTFSPATTGQQSLSDSVFGPPSTGQQIQQGTYIVPASTVQQSQQGSFFGPDTTGQQSRLSAMQPVQNSSLSLGPPRAHSTFARAIPGQQIQQGTYIVSPSTGQQIQQGTYFVPPSTGQQSQQGSHLVRSSPFWWSSTDCSWCIRERVHGVHIYPPHHGWHRRPTDSSKQWHGFGPSFQWQRSSVREQARSRSPQRGSDRHSWLVNLVDHNSSAGRNTKDDHPLPDVAPRDEAAAGPSNSSSLRAPPARAAPEKTRAKKRVRSRSPHRGRGRDLHSTSGDSTEPAWKRRRRNSAPERKKPKQ